MLIFIFLKNHESSIIDSNGKLLDKSISFSNSQTGCAKLISLFKRFESNASNTIIGMEVTGHYWVNLYSYLFDFGFTVNVINSIPSDTFRKMYIRQTKNDSKDSFIIAQIMRFSKFSTTSFADEDIMALRQLSRYRLALVDECSNWKCKCIAILDQLFPEYSKPFSDIFGITSRELFSKYPTPRDMLL